MRVAACLVWFFFRKRIVSVSALLIAAVCAVLVFSGFISSLVKIENYSLAYSEDAIGDTLSLPAQTVDEGSTHMKVWDATNYVYLHNYPVIAGGLLPLRIATPWLLLLLPFLGMLLGACEMSRELETGVARTLYTSPVRKAVLGVSRVVGDSLAAALLITVGMLVGLRLGVQLTSFEIPSSHLVRCVGFVLFLSFYTSIFVQVGTLASVRTRSSANALWVCVVIGLCLFGARLAGENLLSAAPVEYENLPVATQTANRILSMRTPMVDVTLPDGELAEIAPPALVEYLREVNAHAHATFGMMQRVYQQERWISFVSPFHAIWEIASQLLQDRHTRATEIFAPVPKMEPPPAVWQSVRQAWPELAGLLIAWGILFVVNVRMLARLEVQ